MTNLSSVVITKGVSALWPADKNFPPFLLVNEKCAVSFDELAPPDIEHSSTYRRAGAWPWNDENITGVRLSSDDHPAVRVELWNRGHPDGIPYNQVCHPGTMLSQPSDWDEKSVLCDDHNGRMYVKPLVDDATWINVIAYRSAKIVHTHDPKTHVLVPRKTEQELLDWVTSAERSGINSVAGKVGSRATKRFLELCKELGIVTEPAKKTLFERMKEVSNHELRIREHLSREPDHLDQRSSIIELGDTHVHEDGSLLPPGKYIGFMNEQQVSEFVEALSDRLPNKMEMCHLTRQWDAVRAIAPLVLQFLGLVKEPSATEKFAEKYGIPLNRAEEILKENERFG